MIIRFIVPIIMILTSCSTAGSGIPYTYGVFPGLDGKDISAVRGYDDLLKKYPIPQI